MQILSTPQIREWDSYTISNEPILSIDLMERAAQQLFAWIKNHYRREMPMILFAGSGNNGGDALALARILYNEGFSNLKVYLLRIGNLSQDCQSNFTRLEELKSVPVHYIKKDGDIPVIDPGGLIIDGIFGSGLTRPVSGYWAGVINQINDSGNEIVAIDIPSGFFADDNSKNDGAILKATHTLTFQFPKLAFLFAENNKYVGNWHILNISLHKDFLKNASTGKFLTVNEDVVGRLKKRSVFDHKGVYGHAFLIAGSYQKTGAAVLAAKACLRTGAGLLTVHVPESGRQIMQTAIPEAMVCIDESELNYCTSKILDYYTAVGVGPGIGTKKSMQNALKNLIDINVKNMVLDADAINILSENKDWLNLLSPKTILTPHPGEFDRLTHKHESGFERFKTQLELSVKYKIIIVLKGAYTCISDDEGNVFFNSNGNPGMATAGSGDVLTGIILSLLAQNYEPIDAARIGVFLHGMAGNLAADEFGFEALIASDIINQLGNAFKKIKISHK